MIDLVNLQKELFHHIMTNELKVGLADQVRHVLLAASEEVINADDLHIDQHLPVTPTSRDLNRQGTQKRRSDCAISTTFAASQSHSLWFLKCKGVVRVKFSLTWSPLSTR